MTLELEKAKKFKSKLLAGKPCFGAQISLSDPTVAEVFGRSGFDWLVVDTEHSASNAMTLLAMLRAAAPTDAVVLGRPLRLDADEIRRFLDLGAPGILCPFVNTGEESRQFVRACQYPPEGIRGYGPRRAAGYGLDADEYFQHANGSLIKVAIIESALAVRNIDEILSVDGLDGIVIGPMDLSISLGVFKRFDDPAYLAAVDRVRNACVRYKKAMGTGCYSIEHAVRCRENGDPLLLVGGDDAYLMNESRRWLEALRPK